MPVLGAPPRSLPVTGNQPAPEVPEISSPQGSAGTGTAGGRLGAWPVASSPPPPGPRSPPSSWRIAVRSFFERAYAQVASRFGRRADRGTSTNSPQLTSLLRRVDGINAAPGCDSKIRALAGQVGTLSREEGSRLFDALVDRATQLNRIAALHMIIDQFVSGDLAARSREELAPLAAKILRAVDPGEIAEPHQLQSWIKCVALAAPDQQVELLERLRNPMPRIEQRKTSDGSWDVVPRTLHWLLRSDRVGAAAKATIPSLLGKDDLVKANFDSYDLTAAGFRERNLSDSKFNHALLANADFRGATLAGTQFSEATLIGARFEGARINGARFEGANLSGADFQHLQHDIDSSRRTQVKSINLYQANLTRANLHDARLEFFDLSNANLTDADLRGTNPPADFLSMRCRLTNAQLDAGFVTGLEAQLANEKPLLSSARERDFYFNHLDNGGHSVLATIDSIHPEHNEHKVRMVEHLLQGLLAAARSGVDVSDVSSSVLDVLTRDPIYRQSAVCDQFLRAPGVLEKDWERWQTRIAAEPPHEGRLRALMGHVAARLAGTGPEWLGKADYGIVSSCQEVDARAGAAEASHGQWVRENGFGICQVFSFASEQVDALRQAADRNPAPANAPELKQRAADFEKYALAIRNAYMKVAGTSNGQSSKDIEALVQEADDDLSDLTFPVFSKDGHHALLLTNEYLQTCGRGTASAPKPWSQGYVLWPQQGAPEGKHVVQGDWALVTVQKLDLRAILQVAPPLSALYAGENRTEVMQRCFELILPQPYALQALSERDIAHRADGDGKWVVTEDHAKGQHSESKREQEVKVQEILSERVKSLTLGEPFKTTNKNVNGKQSVSHEPSSDYLLNEDFYAKLIAPDAELVKTNGQMDPVKEAYFCRCWAAVLAGLSNSHHFGTETASPESVRYLALAFLNKAERLSESSQAWKNNRVAERLLGTEFSCTAIVFSGMRNALHAASTVNPALREIYQALIPSAW